MRVFRKVERLLLRHVGGERAAQLGEQSVESERMPSPVRQQVLQRGDDPAERLQSEKLLDVAHTIGEPLGASLAAVLPEHAGRRTHLIVHLAHGADQHRRGIAADHRRNVLLRQLIARGGEPGTLHLGDLERLKARKPPVVGIVGEDDLTARDDVLDAGLTLAVVEVSPRLGAPAEPAEPSVAAVQRGHTEICADGVHGRREGIFEAGILHLRSLGIAQHQAVRVDQIAGAQAKDVVLQRLDVDLEPLQTPGIGVEDARQVAVLLVLKQIALLKVLRQEKHPLTPAHRARGSHLLGASCGISPSISASPKRTAIQEPAPGPAVCTTSLGGPIGL